MLAPTAQRTFMMHGNPLQIPTVLSKIKVINPAMLLMAYTILYAGSISVVLVVPGALPDSLSMFLCVVPHLKKAGISYCCSPITQHEA